MASTCPFATLLLKSTKSLSTMPDTCEPTLTVTRADTSPVALTVWLTEPRLTASLRYAGAAACVQPAARAIKRVFRMAFLLALESRSAVWNANEPGVSECEAR